LAVLSGEHLGCTLSGHNIRSPDGSKTVTSKFIFKYNINSSELNSSKLVDLSQGNFPKLITTFNLGGDDRRLEDRVSHANSGLEAYKNGLSEVAIKEFYLAREEKWKVKKFKYLRHALSHPGRLKRWTREGLEKYFGKGYFDLPYGKFDHSSAKNIEDLQIQATELMKIAIDYILKELQKQKSLTP
jgi:hypothetical protein